MGKFSTNNVYIRSTEKSANRRVCGLSDRKYGGFTVLSGILPSCAKNPALMEKLNVHMFVILQAENGTSEQEEEKSFPTLYFPNYTVHGYRLQ